ncbi:hypothetical protein Q5424_25380 [Conexibacter sp. JD483]|uniref:hypothetical protein n=1 Tax=unclassified Conexibacter TaxID=2627773 RepID=UPI0027253D9D|nr:MULTISPECIES: hypothetical protein [unclassified Conexibacter]MDO8189376.1 hypothetical protein [Conexibacter sp. CPCC 205706]MDO8201083.1 hypothetical protein [Conexibacter sp. CPCC 205762]MDR9372455.1 hypothetical protein [Conexibacter sp. JD483]
MADIDTLLEIAADADSGTSRSASATRSIPTKPRREYLGETLGALREVQDRALSGRDPQALADLTRLADHARALSEGLQAPLA